MAARVEFKEPLSAKAYVEEVEKNGLYFIDIGGLHHKVTVEQILTASNAITKDHPRELGVPDNGRSGRSIKGRAPGLHAGDMLLPKSSDSRPRLEGTEKGSRRRTEPIGASPRQREVQLASQDSEKCNWLVV